MKMTVALMMGGDGVAVAEWVGLELRVGRLSIERSWVRNASGGFRMLGKFVYHTLPDASSMSEKDRSRSRASDFPFQKKQFSV